MVHVISFTDNGLKLAKLIQEKMGSECEQVSIHELKNVTLSEWTSNCFKQGETILFIGACGIAVRTIAPFIKSKATDAAVLVMDDAAKYVIPILSGHLGGANKMAYIISNITKAKPVITTATDVNNKFAIDVFASENTLKISDTGKIKNVSAYILKGGVLDVFIDKTLNWAFTGLEGKNELRLVTDINDISSGIAVIISDKSDIKANKNCEVLRLYPQSLILGIGCRRGKTFGELEQFIKEELSKNNLSIESVYKVASIDKKSNEQGIIELCTKHKWQFETYPPTVLKVQNGSFSHSEFVDNAVGVDNVCERSVAAAAANIIVKKTCKDGMTLAVGRRKQCEKFEPADINLQVIERA